MRKGRQDKAGHAVVGVVQVSGVSWWWALGTPAALRVSFLGLAKAFFLVQRCLFSESDCIEEATHTRSSVGDTV